MMDCSRVHIYLWHYLQDRHQLEVHRTVHCAEESIVCSSSIFSSDDSATMSGTRSVRVRRQCHIPARNQVFYAEGH